MSPGFKMIVLVKTAFKIVSGTSIKRVIVAFEYINEKGHFKDGM